LEKRFNRQSQVDYFFEASRFLDTVLDVRAGKPDEWALFTPTPYIFMTEIAQPMRNRYISL